MAFGNFGFAGFTGFLNLAGGGTAGANADEPTAATVSALTGDGYVSLDFDISFNTATRQLLDDAGGIEGINEITTRFYDKFARDRHLYRFLSPEGMNSLHIHARRLALYIAEMMGSAAQPWTHDLETRHAVPVRLATGQMMAAETRQHAHYMAWHSAQREQSKVGRRFKLDDCRVWMRLFFWSAREAGLVTRAPHVFAYLVKFIGHFIAIYEVTARPFTRLEARWSADTANLVIYEKTGFTMLDVVDVPLSQARAQLTDEEIRDHNWLQRPTILTLIGLKG